MKHHRHRYVSSACRHGAHVECDFACPYCASLCKCTSLDCPHHRHEDTHADHPSQHAADSHLRIRLALAIQDCPGFVTDSASSWDLAAAVLTELKNVPVKEENA